ncbi:MAG: hypothetical protein A3I66_10300 [Burkholderiales bacterium RIFCSPLOWO2_02_FULL_57_36]|nr:MAG: hypothetical protein A3I66_10300 [Burkholderiales bacterium RIFCSPLOWO2_02_FULL_57_36]
MPLAVTRAVKRIACNVSQQGVGAGASAATNLCNALDTKRRQRSSGAACAARATAEHRQSLDPDWHASKPMRGGVFACSVWPI